ncbi:unnamed protein product [Blepharisma stoltei]|uniref:Uncharacterized protein n=1 Tax=Blepharisma stoltei TaxID=1481888 RepID=A0AAU9IA27_9CILI|nr:unnamed protein product [Blepharisma stoltei]
MINENALWEFGYIAHPMQLKNKWSQVKYPVNNRSFKSPKTKFDIRDIEDLPETPENLRWDDIFLAFEIARDIGISLVKKNLAIEQDTSSGSTIVLPYFKSSYFLGLLELHLTLVRENASYSNHYDFMYDPHLTIRKLVFDRYTGKYEKIASKSIHYTLQKAEWRDKLYFRFIRNPWAPSKQDDNIEEFTSEQGFYNFSSAVLQPFLRELDEISIEGGTLIRQNFLLRAH